VDQQVPLELCLFVYGLSLHTTRDGVSLKNIHILSKVMETDILENFEDNFKYQRVPLINHIRL